MSDSNKSVCMNCMLGDIDCTCVEPRKRRQFWIQASNMVAHDRKPPIKKEMFHVIEYSAYEELKKRLDEAEERLYHITGSYE